MNINKDSKIAPSEYRDTISTVTNQGKRRWLYVLKPSGKLYNWRNLVAGIYLLIFFGLPLIYYHGQPLFLFNIMESKFIFFGKVFWPQDFYILAFGMVTLIIFIVILTITFGRVFCGWVCPQTIFMEFVFRKIEWWIEGSPQNQRRITEEPWNWDKLKTRGFKLVIFFLVSFLIANTFLSYILGSHEVFKIISEPISEHMELFLGLLFFTLLFFSVYTFVRELVCTTICPYGRLQGVMVDDNTMQVAYDYVRGEPREKYNKRSERHDYCVDCHKCVDVCPTGIDIRNGQQMECIGCTACIDECNTIMHKFNFEPNLIRYASKNNIAKSKNFEFTNKVKAYTALLILLIVVMGTLIATSKQVDATLLRSGGQLFQEVGADSVSNYYEFKVINKTTKPIPFGLKLENIPANISIVGNKKETLEPESLNDYFLFITVPKSALQKRNTKITLNLTGSQGELITVAKANFYGPFK